MPRKRALLASLAAATVSLAGCSQSIDDSSAQTTATTEPAQTTTASTRTTTESTQTTTTSTETTTAARSDDHPVAEGLADEPTLGPDPWAADAALVTFSDPSCPYCREFETETFTQLRDDYVDSGELAFVYRGVSVVQPWGENAVNALEATYERDESAFWSLRKEMYHNHSRFEEGTASAAVEFLAEETDFENPDVVKSEVYNRTHADAIREDERVMDDCDIDGVPGFVFIRDGEVVTTNTGTISYSTAESLLDL